LLLLTSLSHRIAVMQNGRLVESGERDEILKRPKDAYHSASSLPFRYRTQLSKPFAVQQGYLQRIN
jgi:ABC-type dipeptide/oligopeptide/nickel transport system ATPase component